MTFLTYISDPPSNRVKYLCVMLPKFQDPPMCQWSPNLCWLCKKSWKIWLPHLQTGFCWKSNCNGTIPKKLIQQRIGQTSYLFAHFMLGLNLFLMWLVFKSVVFHCYHLINSMQLIYVPKIGSGNLFFCLLQPRNEIWPKKHKYQWLKFQLPPHSR